MKKKRILYTCLATFILLLGCRAQDTTETCHREAALRPLSEYAFIKYDKNTLQFPGERTDFDTLYSKLDGLLQYGRGHVTMMHIGGSHVQAGHFSHRLRSDFAGMKDSIMTQRGILFPYAILQTNAPNSYRIVHKGTWTGSRCIKPNGTDTLGLSGAAVTTADPSAALSFRLGAQDALPWRFCRLRILGYASDGKSFPYALLGRDTLRARHIPEEHSYILDYPAETDSADIRFCLSSGARFTLTGIIPENDRDGIVYHASGINGADVQAWLRCAHLPQDLKAACPDLVLFGIGVNDANVPPQSFDPEQFKARYRKLIALYKEANPHCALLFITNNDCLLNLGRKYGKRTNPNTARVAAAFKELAKEYGGAVWDQYEIMGGSRSSALWNAKGLMRSDRIHFTAEGYQLLGDMLYNAIITDYMNNDGL